MEMKYHEYAMMFPLMEGEEFDELVQDIREKGLMEAIMLHHGKILDGRNRYRACLKADVKPQFTELPPWLDPLNYVVSMNLKRRHLTPGQRAMVGDDLAGMLAKQAKERQGTRTDLGHNIPQNFGESGESVKKAGATLGVSSESVRQAGVLKREAPDLAEKVKTGEKTLHRAVIEIISSLLGVALKDIVVAPDEMDRLEATDLLVLNARGLRIACRIRRSGYASRYPNEFTIRCLRENGKETELRKILDGWGDLMFYGHAADDNTLDIAEWMVIDLDAFRVHRQGDEFFRMYEQGQVGIKRNNEKPGKGTYFEWYDITGFPEHPPIILAKKRH